jgi:hypothetical protein
MFKKLLFVGLVLFLCSSLFAQNGKVEKSFPTPSPCPTGLAFDGKYLWMADRKTDSLYQIDPEDGKVLKSIPSPGYNTVSLTWDGKALWVLDVEENLIFQLDVKTGITLRTISAPSSMPGAICWDGKYLWVADNGAGQITQIEPDDGTEIVSIPAPAKDIQGLLFDGKYLWASDRSRNMIYMLTPEKGEVIILLDAPGPYSRGLAFDGKNLWNVDYQTDLLYKIKIDKDKKYVTSDKKVQSLEYTHTFRNYGPGEIKELDIYIAMPEDLPNQKILLKPVFSPEPKEYIKDQWGQNVAHFKFNDIPATNFVNIIMKTQAELFKTKYFIFPEKVGDLKDIPSDIKEKYLVDDTKYRINDPIIKNAVKEAVGEETNAYWIARKIFRYINDRMRYERVGGWNIAPTVLKRGTGSCSEYSFVFISMCRAAGLPCRYVGSIVIRGDDASTDDVFHRWCEVFLPNYGWIPIDPSGGDVDSPEGQANAVGNLSNRYLITTTSGGGSEYLEWSYNSNEKWTSQGVCKIYVEHLGEWTPIKDGDKEKEDAETNKACKPK